MRCLVVGAGSQGAAAAAILARDADVAGFTLADYDEELAAKVKAKLKARRGGGRQDPARAGGRARR